MSEQQRPPTEEELRAAYEAELKRIRVEDVLVQTTVSLINLGGRKAGLAPGAEDERDLDQLRQAIEGVRALLPLIEPVLGPDASQLRDALSQLQLAYAQGRGGEGGDGGEGGGGGPQGPSDPQSPKPGEPGPAQSSGRLWVPGQ
ncbi:MAG TPA: hypothetical protein VNZ62_07195 [Capillimicrobium sp.]|nr:hypothetical protein [Capillimicrobium sp.]